MNISRVGVGSMLRVKSRYTRVPCLYPNIRRIDALYFMLTIHPEVHYTFKDKGGIYTLHGGSNAYYKEDLHHTWWRTNRR